MSGVRSDTYEKTPAIARVSGLSIGAPPWDLNPEPTD